MPGKDFFSHNGEGFASASAFRGFPALQVACGERQNADICPA
ncbi:hypothetical protein KPSA1_06390 [Pseudomonas syringae pv. actinidiae]|uniref:Uncharacterized protein n=1 Tax=Pseudomonas syringae pv. actinidiae TaxID=103796 RepID=A0A2V0QJ56_PSESF|nr:hypothetical protein KPSA1_06390 [Pseudomonas syringae pv. actinidiae]GBH15109.1 hypothetical protein KPSA3_01029 [Pseudomonas syringae pv. actinidiae]